MLEPEMVSKTDKKILEVLASGEKSTYEIAKLCEIDWATAKLKLLYLEITTKDKPDKVVHRTTEGNHGSMTILWSLKKKEDVPAGSD
jgi:hypothetical protein